MGKEYLRDITVIGLVPSLGPVILFDDMEDLFKWTAGGTAGDRVVEKSATVAYNKGASLHLKSRTTDAAVADLVAASRYTHQRPGKRYRVECLFRYEVYANLDELTFYIDFYDGTTTHSLGIRWAAQEEKWRYKNSAGTFVDLDSFIATVIVVGWHRIEFGFDEHAGKYIDLIVDGVSFDMSSLSYQKTVEGGWTNMVVKLELKAELAVPVEGYFDDLLVLEI